MLIEVVACFKKAILDKFFPATFQGAAMMIAKAISEMPARWETTACSKSVPLIKEQLFVRDKVDFISNVCGTIDVAVVAIGESLHKWQDRDA